ncbi:hypothetical protein [Paenibacillus qinlingensis]|uniref:Dolichyl-phosphate-mannose--protein O-mannosyl transferase n=1 Tax=Paenibacillus qinlingensis TaxID=1837343 RepID=A0ABU1NRW2_9BACL|nr:hypothetical protein [Paenibacillus qinlingensis]MDR6550215.1 dolichyl-phosphate-mannose--protein O-mannosyl transferase [Paenibacillus qinlingensis]
MILITLIYLIYLILSFWSMMRVHTSTREKIINVVITTIGYLLFASILIDHPIDTNKIIGWMIDKVM